MDLMRNEKALSAVTRSQARQKRSQSMGGESRTSSDSGDAVEKSVNIESSRGGRQEFGFGPTGSL